MNTIETTTMRADELVAGFLTAKIAGSWYGVSQARVVGTKVMVTYTDSQGISLRHLYDRTAMIEVR